MFEDKDERTENEGENTQVNFTMQEAPDTSVNPDVLEAHAGEEQQDQAEQYQEQQYREQQYQEQHYQQQEQGQPQYSYTVRDDASDDGNGGTSDDGNGGGRRERTQRRRRPYLTAVGCSVLCGVIVAGCILGSSIAGRNMIRSEKESIVVTTSKENLAAAVMGEEAIEGVIQTSGNIVGAETVSATTGSAAVDPEDTDSEDTDSAIVSSTVVADDTEYTIAQIAEYCGSSVVAITNRSVSEVMTMFGSFSQEIEGSGSGVIIGLNDDELLIVTNYHVVEDADELTVCFFDSEDAVYGALVKGTDPNNDLAVVSIPLQDMDVDVLERISIATIGNSDDMHVGDGVVAIGNALGLGQSVTSGIISAVDREVTIDNYTARLLQTDAAINPGNSGGALFNMKGELIGINSAKYASEEIEGMGFAIPTSVAEPIIETLMNQMTREKLDKNYGALNITGSDVSTEAYQTYGMPTGVYVNSVLEGGAAANAGIQTGDIITAMDGISLTGISMLKDRLQYFEAGETVELTVARNSGNGYEEFDVEVTLDNASEQDESAFEDSYDESEDDSYSRRGGDSYGYDDGDSYDYGYDYGYGYDDDDGDYYYGYGDIEDFFNQFGNSFGGR